MCKDPFYSIIFFAILWLLPLYAFSLVSAHAANSYTVAHGATVEVNEHGNCRRVTNNSGGTRYLSTKTSAEWSSYVNNPNGLAMASCVSYNYGAWGAWSGCSATCGGGTQSHTRSCLRSTDGAAVDCSLCGGVCSESQACNTQACVSTPKWVAYGWVDDPDSCYWTPDCPPPGQPSPFVPGGDCNKNTSYTWCATNNNGYSCYEYQCQ